MWGNRLWRRSMAHVDEIGWRKTRDYRAENPDPPAYFQAARRAGPIIRMIWASRNFLMVAVL
jgi:hypothetical protein